MTIAKKKIERIILIVLLCLIIVTGLVFLGLFGSNVAKINKAGEFDYAAVQGSAKNVVLMIGDGMGFNHIEMLKHYEKRESLFMESAAVKGEVTTFSRTFIGPTDSAAAATALATGEKVLNGRVAYRNGKNLRTITDIAAEAGKATGVIATESMYGATPAAFSGHAKSRGADDKIFASQLDSGVDLFFGLDKGYAAKQSEIEAAGYDFATFLGDFSGVDKVFGAFSEISTDYSATDKLTLAMLATSAIEFLSAKSPDGFFLMIEESHIDKKSHANEYGAMLAHLNAYDETVKAVVNKVGTDGDTLVIVTADHETGGIKANGDSKYGYKFTKGHHSTANVPYFMFGNVTGVPSVIDNTNIFGICKKFISLSQNVA